MWWAGDPYFAGKMCARMARLALIAEELNQVKSSSSLSLSLELCFDLSLKILQYQFWLLRFMFVAISDFHRHSADQSLEALLASLVESHFS
jgi:hypothetical protein